MSLKNNLPSIKKAAPIPEAANESEIIQLKLSFVKGKNQVSINQTAHADTKGKFKGGKKYQNRSHNH